MNIEFKFAIGQIVDIAKGERKGTGDITTIKVSQTETEYYVSCAYDLDLSGWYPESKLLIAEADIIVYGTFYNIKKCSYAEMFSCVGQSHALGNNVKITYNSNGEFKDIEKAS